MSTRRGRWRRPLPAGASWVRGSESPLTSCSACPPGSPPSTGGTTLEPWPPQRSPPSTDGTTVSQSAWDRSSPMKPQRSPPRAGRQTFEDCVVPGELRLNGARPVRAGRRCWCRWRRSPGWRWPQRSPPSTGGTTAILWLDGIAARAPQRSPPSTGGATPGRSFLGGRPRKMPQRSPPSTGGTTRARGPRRRTGPPRSLNGARPVRAGRQGRAGDAPDVGSTASTEPAQYRRDDPHPHSAAPTNNQPQRSPPSTGGTTSCGDRTGEAGRSAASTEPAQYGRDDDRTVVEIDACLGASTEPAQYGRDDGDRGEIPLRRAVGASTEPAQHGRDDDERSMLPGQGCGSRLNGARPVRAGRRTPPHNPLPRRHSLNGARPVRAGRPPRFFRRIAGLQPASTEPAQYGRDDVGTWVKTLGAPGQPQRSPPSTGGTTEHGDHWYDQMYNASTEPAQYGRDDRAVCGAAGHSLPASTEPAQYGRDDPRSPVQMTENPSGLNGARPVRAGRPHRGNRRLRLRTHASTEPAQYGRDDLQRLVVVDPAGLASTEPAQYGRDDTGLDVPLPAQMNAASTEPAQYGRDDSQDEQAEAYRRALASTEPAQYGRDDFIIDPGHGLEIVASTEPAQYGRDDRERCGGAARGRPRLNGARPVRAGRRRRRPFRAR